MTNFLRRAGEISQPPSLPTGTVTNLGQPGLSHDPGHNVPSLSGHGKAAGGVSSGGQTPRTAHLRNYQSSHLAASYKYNIFVFSPTEITNAE